MIIRRSYGICKNGPFRLAIEAKVPIVPGYLAKHLENDWEYWHKYGSKPGICRMCLSINVSIETATSDRG